MHGEKEAKIKIDEYREIFNDVRKEMSKIVVGQENIINGLLRAILANGHVLVEGIPGLAKTLIIRALATISGCDFKRIQFTVDLLPTDIVGMTIYTKEKGFSVIKGPIFSNFILADEINRSPQKVQSALIESMQERQVTIGGKTLELPEPFFVLATLNPIETLGVYPLPEAQIDRFLFKLIIDYPKEKEEKDILEKNITIKNFKDYNLKKIISEKKIIEMQNFIKKVYVNDDIKEYIVKIINVTRRPSEYNLKYGRYINWGGSPRASIGLYIGSKANAILKGRFYVTPQDIKEIAHEVLRHRILLNYEGQVEGITTDMVISEILSKIPVP
jgi:MoxR-like ATPase